MIRPILSLLFLSFSIACYGEGTTPSEALQKLTLGNQRYIEGKSIHPDQAESQREKTFEKQQPFAVVIGCSDSRVPPEIIFDQGLGDIFVVRVAGNVVGPLEKDSVEFAVTELKAPLIMVLGHQKCGAVTAVVRNEAKKYEIEEIAPLIEPALKIAKTMPGDLITNTILENIKLVIKTLESNPLLSPYIQSGKLSIVGGYYELDKGNVTLVPSGLSE